MHYEIKGTEYPVFDWDWTLSEAFFLKEKAYLTTSQIGEALKANDPHAVAAFIYIVKRRANELIKWDDIVKNYKFSDFQVVKDELDPDTGEGDEAEDPTPLSTEKRSKPAGKTRTNAT